MNHWYQARRMRRPIVLITIGVLALLSVWHIARFEVTWPLILIVIGLLKVAERAAWTADVREQRAAQGFVPAMGGNPVNSDPVNPSPANPSYWSTASPQPVAEGPLIQTHPPAPEDSGRDDR
jgi:hypothetical protein